MGALVGVALLIILQSLDVSSDPFAEESDLREDAGFLLAHGSAKGNNANNVIVTGVIGADQRTTYVRVKGRG